MKKAVLLFVWVTCLGQVRAQTDSLLLKISHAEPLYMDLIRDLGARKGERELNLGWHLEETSSYLSQSGFLEYEFSPLNRLGLELEVPFSYRYAERGTGTVPLPRERVEGLKLAAQYTLWVSGKYRASVALGNIYELKFHSFHTISRSPGWLKGQEISPFLVIAKRWGAHWHSMLYSGPVWEDGFAGAGHQLGYQLNLSVHYVLPGSGHFLGAELNQEYAGGVQNWVLRPQVKLKLGSQAALGLVTGIPLYSQEAGLSFLVRFIYEPPRRNK